MGFKIPTTATISLTLLGLCSAFYYDTPEDCSWSPLGDSDNIASVFLTCKLSSINSRLERTNFSVIPADTTRGLKILCTDSHIGHLEPAGFSSLQFLEELVIDGCALESIPSNAFEGLVSLKKLTVSTRNLSVLRLQSDSFSHLAGLERLDLSDNRVRGFPAGVLCQLSQLCRIRKVLGQGPQKGSFAPCTPPTCLDLTCLTQTIKIARSGLPRLA